ncbi:MAG TPA: type VI secretion protein IcmF/TssM N-terminal domain-containing protein [Herpetosiphonaceae bacterium]
MSSAARPAESHSPASYFSHGLLSKIIPSDRHLARPTDQVLRRRWLNRMILAELGFVVGVVLLQFFPVIETSATTQPAPTATVAAATVTAIASPVATESAMIVAPTASAEPTTLTPAQPSAPVPVALPDTGSAAALDTGFYAAPLLCLGVGLVVWLLAGTRSAHDSSDASLPANLRRDDEGFV